MGRTGKIYLGDSVYAEFDGMHVVLTTNNGLPTDPSNEIFLEGKVINALFQYVESLKPPKEETE